MKQNKYDDPAFFDSYAGMQRSRLGLEGAGEWHAFRKLFPDLRGKRVLDLGCGYGWHCRYAAEQGAESVLGVDLSERMLAEARRRNSRSNIKYRLSAIEDFAFPETAFDVALSSLAFHYLASFDDICKKVWRCLAAGGHFVFSVEHPVFTAEGTQRWCSDEAGNHRHWPVDDYFREGARRAEFLGESVVKYHRTLTTYVDALIGAGFALTALVEPEPAPDMLETVPEMRDELRRPMMLLLSARKPAEPPSTTP